MKNLIEQLNNELSKNDVQIVCGCFKGNLNDFKNKVEETHKNNDIFLKEYRELIEIVEYLISK